VTFPVYVPVGSFATRFEVVIVIVFVDPLPNEPPSGLTYSQFALSSVLGAADQEPVAAPQLLIVTDCGEGSFWLAAPIKVSVWGVTLIQGGDVGDGVTVIPVCGTVTTRLTATGTVPPFELKLMVAA
jgi:hypothetical protein